jgi:hypothetical protein
MFGDPAAAMDESAIFHLVWTYLVQELDGRKKAQCVCNGSSCSGQVKVLDHTYANCVERTGVCIFYAISTAEKMLVYGADVYNVFAKAPAPKQGFFIYPDQESRTGGSIRKGNHQSPMVTSYLSLAPCKATPNPLASGKNTLTASYGALA